MRIHKITFDNYRCFLNGTIEFPTTTNKNMVVLVGPNGGGKTETLFAFWWTLYDFDFSKLTNKENTSYALNSGLYRELEQANIGSIKKCSVTLEFEESGITYVVQKWCEYKKTEKQIRVEEYRTFSYYLPNGELSLPIRDAEKINKSLNSIIPKSILYGIIFDGERMQKLNTPDENSVNAIKGVISNITNVELLEKCSEYFGSIKRNLNKQLKQEDSKHNGVQTLPEIINELEEKEKNLARDNKLIEDYEAELSDINIQLQSISNALEKNKEVQDIERERKTQKELLDRLEKNLDSYYKNFAATLRDGYLLASESLLADVENIIKKYDVPQFLTVPAVKSILARPKCICGKELDADAIEKLNMLIGMLPPDNINSTLVEMIRQLRTRAVSVKDQAKSNYDLIFTCEQEIKECKDTIASLSTRITSIDDTGEVAEEAKKLENDNIRYLQRKGYLGTELPRVEADAKDLENDIKKLKFQRDDYISGEGQSNKINKQIQYIEKCCQALTMIKETNKNTALDAINKMLSDSYKLLSEDAERGRKIKIIEHNKDKKYQLAVYMESDFNKQMSIWKKDGTYDDLMRNGSSEQEIEEAAIVKCIDSNSTGQSKINTFAFVKAILDYSNSSKKENGIEVQKDYPLLIDAPFGDISDGNLSRSSKELHNFAHQVILMIDKDKYDALKNAFAPYTVKKYCFKKSSNSNFSTIVVEDN